MSEWKHGRRAPFGLLVVVVMMQFVRLAAGAFVQLETTPNLVQTKVANLIIGVNIATVGRPLSRPTVSRSTTPSSAAVASTNPTA